MLDVAPVVVVVEARAAPGAHKALSRASTTTRAATDGDVIDAPFSY